MHCKIFADHNTFIQNYDLNETFIVNVHMLPLKKLLGMIGDRVI